MTQQSFSFNASDGTPLASALFEPTGKPHSAVLIAGALGVNQSFYAAFASWLAQRGHLVMTFDLRGMGVSRQPQHKHSLRGLDIDMLGWRGLTLRQRCGICKHSMVARRLPSWVTVWACTMRP